MTTYVDPIVSSGKTMRVSVTHNEGTYVVWPSSVKKLLVRVRNNDVHCRLGTVAVTGLDVVCFADVDLTHAAFAPAPPAVGSYLRGAVSGAVGRVVKILSATSTRVAMNSGSVVFVAENVTDSASPTGLPAGANSALVGTVGSASQIADPTLYKSNTDPQDDSQIIYNSDVSTYVRLALRSEAGTAEVDLEPVA